MPQDQILRALLTRGFFPAELPPPFTTRDFGTHVVEILRDWEAQQLFRIRQKSGRRHAYSYVFSAATPELVSKPKGGYERRNIHITHPLPQALLASEIAYNWRAVQKWLAKQTYSLDEIRVSMRYARSIKGINFPMHRAKKAYLEGTSDWLVRTDITRFYPSIYTHSIPWAAYGKEKVKANLKNYEGSLGDRLDQLVRKCNRDQTVGIPIGPETS